MMHSMEQIRGALEGIHYTAPCVILIYFLVAITASICTAPKVQAEGYMNPGKTTPRRTIMFTVLMISLSYVGESALVIAQIFNTSGPLATTDCNIYALSSCLLWVIFLAVLANSKDLKWWPFYVSWLGALAVEATLLGLSVSYQRPLYVIEIAQTVSKVCHVILIILLLALYFVKATSKSWKVKNDEEAAPLLAHPNQDPGAPSGPNYGSTATDSSVGNEPDKSVETSDEDKEVSKHEARMKRIKDRIKEKGNWFSYAREFLIFVPYIWSSTRKDLQLSMAGVGIILVCVRALNVLVPRQLGIVVNSLGAGPGGAPFLQLGIYIVLSWASSSAGLLGLKNWLWYPVELNARQAIKTASYNHIMELSCDFHDSKRSGELYQSMWQGESVLDLMEMLTFQLVPMVVDLVVACVYLYTLFGPYMFLIVTTTTVMYFWVSFDFTTRQADAYRHNVKYSRKEFQVMYDSMGGWKTVSYFNRLKHAKDQYATIATQHTNSKKIVYLWHWLSTAIQDCVLDIGLFGACFFAIYQVVYSGSNVGNFVTLLTYWSSLSAPLAFLSSAHRDMMSNLIDAEQLLELFQTKPSVTGGTKSLPANIKGLVEFDHVNFGYDGKKQTITDLSFHVAPGKTIALIGETGGGKSTILKLLFRFYDITSGSLRVDGHDIRELSLESLRERIGVVPQDPTLFNDTIISNLRYARLDATNEEIMNACKAAAVHDKIMTFADGYQSKVGEHGVRLSGGELQRIAIARAILKDPSIILLDEATSSVDSETEGKIQEALKKLSKDRTTFIVAHRLSTIMDADLILVIKDGRILEQGPPVELMKAKGKYYSLWIKQMGIADVSLDADSEAKKTLESLEDPGDVEGPADGMSGVQAKTDQTEELIKDTVDSSKPVEELKRAGFSSEPSSPVKKMFRPNAPDFVPHLKKVEGAKQSQASRSQNQPSHLNNQDVITTKAIEEENGSKSRKRKPRQDASAGGPNFQVGGSTDSVETQGNYSQKPQSNGNGAEPKAKRHRVNKRHHSKSEPSSQITRASQGDGSGKVDIPSTESSEGQIANPPGRRRSSAPTIRLEGATNPQNLSDNLNRRRRRWRNRNRDTSAISRDPSTTTSGEWSAASTPHRESPGPTNTPVNEAVSSGKVEALSSYSNIRFASGS